MVYKQIDQIQPDPSQPRRIFDDKHIEGLAVSLSIEGMINPIEIDPNGYILTGECRWRAAKRLNWDTVPVNMNERAFTDYERLRHQMAENVHQSGSMMDSAMNPVDVAKGYHKLLQLKGISGPFGEYHPAVKELSTEIGVSAVTIWQYLSILDQPEFVIKDIEQGRPRSYYIIADTVKDEETRQAIKTKISLGDYHSREEIQQDVVVIRDIGALSKSTLERERSKESIATNRILNGVAKVALALEGIHPMKIDGQEKGIVLSQLSWLKKRISEYTEELTSV